MVDKRTTRVWKNPFSGKTEVVLETPTKGSGAHLVQIAFIEKGAVRFLPDAYRRLEANGITEEQIFGDLEVLSGPSKERLP